MRSLIDSKFLKAPTKIDSVMQTVSIPENPANRLLKNIPMTGQAILIGVICGLVVWAVLDGIQSESLRSIFMRQVLLQLDKKADESIAEFRREVHRHALSVRLLALNNLLVFYVNNSNWSVNSNPSDEMVIYQGVPPPWMPKESTWRDLVEPSHILLMNPMGQTREVFQVQEKELPEVVLSINSMIGEQVNLQPHIALLDGMPHLLVPEAINNLEHQIRGIIMLVIPLNDDFPGIAQQGLSSQNAVVAIVDDGPQLVLASSAPTKLPSGSPLGPVRNNYVITGRPFPELSAAHLSLQFVVMLPKAQVEGVNTSVQQLGRKQRVVAASAYISVFTLVIFLLSGRINRLLRRIREFSERALGHTSSKIQGGNQLVLLEEQVNRLIQSVITAREKMLQSHEKKLQESYALKGAILDAALDCIITIDQKGAIMDFNNAAEQTFGYSNREVVGKNVLDVVIPASLRTRYKKIFTRYATDQTINVSGRRLEIQVARRNGSEFPVALAISPLQLDGKLIFTAYLHDIIERKRAENEIKSLAKFPSESPNPMLRINHRGVIVYANSASLVLLKYWGCDVGQTLPLFWQQQIADVLSFGKNKESEVVCEDRIFSLLISPMVESDYANVYGRDITQIRQAEELSLQHQAELVHVCRLSTMGEMATGLAHELNQPLAAIVNYARGCTRRLETNSAEPKAMHDALEQIYRQASRAGEIIKRLRSLVRKRDQIRTVIDCSQLAQDAVTFSEFEARKRDVNVTLVLDDRVLLVDVDVVQIEQVALNLIKNGIDAIAAAGNWAKREIVITTQCKNDDTVEFLISDTGIGISVEAMQHLFDPFFSTKANGMGMGLAISNTIITNHGGRLWAHRNPNVGTTFYFSLPLIREVPSDDN